MPIDRQEVTALEVAEDLALTNSLGDGTYEYVTPAGGVDGWERPLEGSIYINVYGDAGAPTQVTSRFRLWLEVEAVE